jgi:hypothetical protein
LVRITCNVLSSAFMFLTVVYKSVAWELRD